MGRFLKQIIDTFGHVAEAELIHVREVGFTDGEVLSIISLSVQFMFANYEFRSRGGEGVFDLYLTKN